MPRRVVTLFVCSICEKETVEPGEVLSLTIQRAGAAPLLLDLCIPCQSEPLSMERFLELGYTEGPRGGGQFSGRRR